MLHSTDNCFGKHTNQKRIKDGLGGPIGSRVESVKQYKKSEKKMEETLSLSRIRTICFIALPRNTANTIKSRRSGLRLLISAVMVTANLTVTSQTMIPQYPVIATEMSIDGLLDVRL